MMLLALIPWWGRLIALLALVAAIWGHGAYTGYSHEHGKLVALQSQFEVLKATVAAEGKAAQEHTAKVEQQQKDATNAVIQEYARRLAALPKFGGVRQPTNPSGGEITQISCPAPSVNGAAADPVPVAAVSVQDFDTLATLAAQTTQQLVSLQSWILGQQRAFQ